MGLASEATSCRPMFLWAPPDVMKEKSPLQDALLLQYGSGGALLGVLGFREWPRPGPVSSNCHLHVLWTHTWLWSMPCWCQALGSGSSVLAVQQRHPCGPRL